MGACILIRDKKSLNDLRVLVLEGQDFGWVVGVKISRLLSLAISQPFNVVLAISATTHRLCFSLE
jgi:hypothetical protein